MFVKNTILLVSAFAALANGAATVKKCSTVKSGFFETFVGEGNAPLTLSSANELTSGNGTAIQAVFQNCPATPNSEYQYNGRVVLSPSNLCLTISNPNDASGPYFAVAAKCTSDTKPSLAQQWGFGNDFGDVIFSSGTVECGTGGAGILLNETDGSILLASHSRVQLGCSVTWQSMTINETE